MSIICFNNQYLKSGNEQFMNNIFELNDFSGVKAKMEPLSVGCSNWLPRVDSNHEPAG